MVPVEAPRFSGPNIVNRSVIEVCFLVENVTLVTSDEMRVVDGSPRKKATLPAAPNRTPLDGLAPITGAKAIIGLR